jgi:transposase
MEATGVYWKAPWAILEDEFDCMLVNARHVNRSRAARPTSLMQHGCVSSPKRDC